jgi:hypothetical protein
MWRVAVVVVVVVVVGGWVHFAKERSYLPNIDGVEGKTVLSGTVPGSVRHLVKGEKLVTRGGRVVDVGVSGFAHATRRGPGMDVWMDPDLHSENMTGEEIDEAPPPRW